MSSDVYKRLQQGFDAISLTMEDVVKKDSTWKYLSVFLYDEGPVESEKWIVIPEFFLFSIALSLYKRRVKTILLLDSTREHTYSISSIPEWYRNFFAQRKLSNLVYFFGSDFENIRETLEVPQLKLDIRKVIESDFLPLALKANLPIHREMDKGRLLQISDLESLSSFIMDFMRPPTLKEELKKELSTVSVERIGSHVISSLTLIFNPGAAMGKGLTYAFKFMRIVSKMESEEYQKFAKQWRENIEKFFNTEALSQIIGKSNLEEAKKKLEKENLLVIIGDGFRNLQNTFIPILLENLLADVKEVTLLFDSITFMDRYDFFLKWLMDKIENHEISLGAITPTMGEFSERFNDFFKKLISEKAIVFDLSSKFMRILFRRRSTTEEAWVVKHLYKIKELEKKGDIAFVFYNSASPVKWGFIRPSLLTKIKRKLFGK